MASYIDLALIQACRTLFGSDIAVNLDFLRYLEPSGVKSAYRKKAFETHPDRVIALGPAAVRHQTALFVAVTSAHDRLMTFLADRECMVRNPSAARSRQKDRETRSSAPPPPRQSRFFSGTLPMRHLLFGEYLYYSRTIPQHALTEALAWQRRQRPRFGDIARRWHFLSDSDIEDILLSKRFGEPLGEAAIRLMLLSRFQVNTILHFQRKNQQPIGEFFTLHGHIMRFMLKRLLQDNSRHNEQFRTLSRI